MAGRSHKVSKVKNLQNVNTEAPTLGRRVRQARRAKKLTQKDLGKSIGVKQTAISELEAGRIRRPKFLYELSRVLERSEEWLLGRVSEAEEASKSPIRRGVYAETVEVPVVGTVEAGVFRVVDGFDDAIEPAKIVVARDPRFPRATMAAFVVQGDSMNAVGINPGDIVIAVDFVGSGLPLRDGMTIVVQRSVDGGQTLEWTIKEVQTFKDRIELQPRSTNKKHKPITVRPNYDHEGVTKTNDGGEEIKVLGIVIRITKEVPI
jgi:transcriptional regulator with XRE-family HTH domain